MSASLVLEATRGRVPLTDRKLVASLESLARLDEKRRLLAQREASVLECARKRLAKLKHLPQLIADMEKAQAGDCLLFLKTRGDDFLSTTKMVAKLEASFSGRRVLEKFGPSRWASVGCKLVSEPMTSLRDTPRFDFAEIRQVLETDGDDWDEDLPSDKEKMYFADPAEKLNAELVKRALSEFDADADVEDGVEDGLRAVCFVHLEFEVRECKGSADDEPSPPPAKRARG